jgi:hypothetical protein
MISVLVLMAAIVVLAIYLARRRSGLRRRNVESWDSLLARLQPDWSARELGDPCFTRQGANSSLEQKWNLIQGARGLWSMFENARVMMEIADYAARNNDAFDRELLASIRYDAMQIRFYVVIALGQYAFGQMNENLCVNAYRAVSMYVAMTTRVTQQLEANAGVMLPSFVAAM